ncbi:mini-chromosome maintenance complex-binding protein isoform X3 [Marmota monax]|uniref:mini-chromosome maintenance complex-binding protein isoform X3 n=1 Tax=Marmota monax TaxID=9995 RepID=UPI0026EEECB8|nr:mini-chromosome maintenance complex-binding protein isoform X3 [Marmota monax]
MPCGEDWLSHPLGIVQGFFAQNGVSPDWEKKVIEYFKEKLKENNAPKWVPSLNEVPLHYLKPNSFVKFRCMIQDMFDPEFYMGVYETVNQNTKARVLHFGKYRDIAECGPQQELDLNSPRSTTLERQTFYCVPVPGESTWVKEAYVNANQARVSPSTSYTPSRHKRSYEDDEDMDLQPHKQKDQHAGARQAGSAGGLQWCGEPKRLETEASTGQQLSSLNFSSPFDLNFPLPGEKGPACLVKVYEDWEGFKVNDVLELYGVLSVDPVLSILGNDERYTRRDVLPLGKFTVNLSGCPRNSTFTEHLYRIIQHLVPASFRLQMTIENMNHLKFIPHKDYTANRLVSGLLQLPNNTSLFIDETLLEQGQLDTPGVHNVTALSNLITWQKVDYDFSYHQMEFPCSINVLITSEGRSLLPADCQIHLQPQLIPPNMEEYTNSLLSAVLPSVLNKFRIYLTLLRFLDYSISDEITKAVEDDFVEMRKNDPQSITADDLHQLLVVARFLSLSAGQTTLSRERWLRAKQLESLRRNRLQQQKCVNGNEL